MLWRCTTGLFLMTCCACLGQTGIQLAPPATQWAPPRLALPDALPPPTVPQMMISSLRIGKVRIYLEKTMRTEAQHRLGGIVGARGDGGDYEAWLCYQGSDQNGPWGLWLT